MALVRANTSGGGGSGGYYGDFTPNTSTFTEIDLGFAPNHVFFYTVFSTDSQIMVFHIDVTANKIYRSYGAYTEYDLTSTYSSHMYVSGTKVYYKAYSAPALTNKTYIIAS